MRYLITFEMKKIGKSVFFPVMLGCIFLMIVFYFIFVYTNTERKENILENEKISLHSYEKEFLELEEVLASGEKDFFDPEFKSEYDGVKHFFEEKQAIVTALENNDWQSYLQVENDKLIDEPYYQEYLEKGRILYSTTYSTDFNMITYIERNKWLYDHQIAPVLPLTLFAWLTAYDVNFSDDLLEELVKKLAVVYSSTGYYFLYHLFSYLFSIIGIAVFILLFGQVVTREGYGSNGTLHLLWTQPIQRRHILISKFIAILFVSVVIILCITLFSFLLGTIFDRMGEWNYPILIYGEEVTFSFMKLAPFLMKSLGLFFILLIFSYTLHFLFSLITKRALISVVLTISVIGLGSYFRESLLSFPFSQYLPFHYVDIFSIVTNEYAVVVNDFRFTYLNGILSFVVSILIVVVFIYFVLLFQQKHVR
ncbi:MAG TPA: ABC transporter permease subunit [Cerasibacillus sp.]|uniref:ABC transporter permease subunit n=1 Tax=Cerasibacillus sp. TaxID=2498711 RepID=UPI002F4143FD